MDLRSSLPILDYVVFVGVLLISLLIGIVFSCRQNSTEEYMHGSRSLGLLPVSFSLVVSFVSAISIQGYPSEVYLYGMNTFFVLFAQFGLLSVLFTFLPIFYEMKYNSIFEYLEDRYGSNKPRILANVLTLTGFILYSGITIFGPAAALENLTGFTTEYNIVAMGAVCTVYTSLGGIRGVIWTDVFQGFIMIGGLIFVLAVGLTHVGLGDIWYELERRGHTQLNFDPSITQRGSVWIFSLGIAIQKFNLYSNQSPMLRYTGLPTLRLAKLSIIIGCVGFIFMQFLSLALGAVVFAYYSRLGCGPLGSGDIYSPNQIMSYFVIDVINLPGVSGLFLSAIVASSLSSVSSAQNSFAVAFWKDILVHLLPKMSDIKKTAILKLVTLIFGILSIAIAFAAMYIGGTLIQISAVVMGIIGSPPFGMFVIGACCTFVSSSAAVIGCLCSLAFFTWVSIGRYVYGTVWTSKPEVIDDLCYNTTAMGTTQVNFEETTAIYDDGADISGLIRLYSISPFLYSLIGSGLTMAIAVALSLIPAFRHREPVNPKLLFPFVRRFVRSNTQEIAGKVKLEENGEISLQTLDVKMLNMTEKTT